MLGSLGPKMLGGLPINTMSIQYMGAFQNSGTHTSVDFTSCDFGAEAQDRIIMVACGRGGSGAHTVSSATINGVAATIVKTQGANLSGTGIAVAKVPTGTTGLTVSITWSGSAAGTGIAIYRVTGGGLFSQSGDDAETTSNNTVIECDVTRGAVAVFVSACRSGAAASSVGLTSLDVDNVTTAGTGDYYVGHYRAGDVPDEPGRDFSIDAGGGADRINTIVFELKPLSGN